MNIRLLFLISMFATWSMGGFSANETVKLGPKIKITDAPDNIYSAQNLERWSKSFVDVQILSDKCVNYTPRVIANKAGTVMSQKQDEIYINRLDYIDKSRPMNVYRMGLPVRGANPKSIVGIPFYYVGETQYQNYDAETDLSLLKITAIDSAVLAGDRILNKRQHPPLKIREHSDPLLNAAIVEIIAGVNYAEMNSSVIINAGSENSSIKPGDILSVMKAIKSKRSVQLYENKFFKHDNFTSTFKDPKTGKVIPLPEEAIANLLVYDVFDNASVALVLTNSKEVQLYQKVTGYKK